MEQKTTGSVDGALSNLQSIKNGEDPRQQTESPDIGSDIQFVDQSDLRYRTGKDLRTREEVHEIFLELVNIIEPHNEYGDYDYPIDSSQLYTSYCKKTSSVNAKCGPRFDGVFFACDIDYVSEMTTERFFTLLVHELTHVTEGSHTQGSGHNPTFWSQMTENAVTAWKTIGDKYGINRDRFFSHCREKPNRTIVDRRMVSVEQQKQMIEDDIRSMM